MARDASPTVSQRRLAAELRRLREDARRTGTQLAEALDWSTSKISRIEKAQVVVQRDDVARLADFYQIEPKLRETLLALSMESEAKGWWDGYADSLPDSYVNYIGLEWGAQSMLTWQNVIFPGLFQTADYARAAMGLGHPLNTMSPAEVERRARLRLQRQGILQGPGALDISALVDESVLYRRFGTPEVMRDQLLRVVEIARLPNVSIRVLPLNAPHMHAHHGFVLLRFPPRDGLERLHDDVVYLEKVTGGAFEEGEKETYLFDRLFYQMSIEAMSDEDSVDFIADLADRSRST
ncbi:helix-turn-helix transcriptional regulator [Nonomuraea sp. NPDC046570]|uniref:helix-turn-helix domain-containing protein n=1 Tax=Nonomuraea sp. NPDC046570 TaxID=3155255 RepID=UPI003409A8E4